MIPVSTKFANDINSVETSIHPLVIIGWDNEALLPTEDAIFISQNPETIDGIFYSEANLKISSIKESIDIESRKFKIGNISLTLSNYENLSDDFSNINISNREVAIFYKSPSCKNLNDCLLVYVANIRRYTHDEKSIKLELEDNTEEKISKDIPISNLGTDPASAYSEKYYNRYIPIAYGYQLLAPAIPYPRDSVRYPGDFYVICDDILNSDRDIETNTLRHDAVYIKKGEYWKLAADKHSNLDGGAYSSSRQHYPPGHGGNNTSGAYLFKNLFQGGLPLNIIAANEFQGIKFWYPKDLGLIDSNGYNWSGNANSNITWLGPHNSDDKDIISSIEKYICRV